MDPRVSKILNQIAHSFVDKIEAVAQSSQKKMTESFEACYSKNGQNPDRFAQCFKEKQEKLDQLTNTLQPIITQYYPKHINYCLQNKRSMEECSQSAKTQISEFLENIKIKIDRL